uniref:Uncharacterized protein n=1 Tax=Chromera velia CCMP2878 TaxID=1169474 RepID=A0A0G4G3J7_9ALVE|eukprot:Cvel_20021.t1-p1 / transcript=Cvel_20021.t1 / gene=Cvel_20021 / organism=Chromera_velia_CCMP2878 / gene_product=hypothetical protein / transcript_product=hypothetical protein / location=Cvel_scaffold1767:32760-34466(-) / protein_length=219 / sequence_SO=supercontig / SO=protein_coding / is_pseudo=false
MRRFAGALVIPAAAAFSLRTNNLPLLTRQSSTASGVLRESLREALVLEPEVASSSASSSSQPMMTTEPVDAAMASSPGVHSEREKETEGPRETAFLGDYPMDSSSPWIGSSKMPFVGMSTLQEMIDDGHVTNFQLEAFGGHCYVVTGTMRQLIVPSRDTRTKVLQLAQEKAIPYFYFRANKGRVLSWRQGEPVQSGEWVEEVTNPDEAEMKRRQPSWNW